MDNDDRSGLRALGLVTQVGCSIAIELIGSVVGGILLDRAIGTSPLFLIVGIFVGFVLSGYSLYKLIPTSPRRSAPRTDRDTEETGGKEQS